MTTLTEKRTFTVPTRDEVAPVNQANFDALNKAFGFVPNLYATIAYSENGLKPILSPSKCKNIFVQQRKRSDKPDRKSGKWLHLLPKRPLGFR